MSTPTSHQRPSVVTSGTSSPTTSIDTPRSGTPASGSPFPSRSPVPSRSPSVAAGITSPNAPTSSNTLQPPGTSSSRRNRAALRDYYGLKKQPDDGAASSRGTSPDPGKDDGSVDSGSGVVIDRELDALGFNAETYVDGLLESQGLDSLLKTESALVNEIKYLTSERAALVYDNYSKLIAATDTIQHMRSNMKPLAPATSTLAPTVAHIAGTAEQLAFKTADSPRAEKNGGQTVTVKREDEEDAKRRKDRATVRWVLDAPRRIRENGPEEAEWDTVRRLLENWHGAGLPGIEKVKVACERAVEERGAVKG